MAQPGDVVVISSEFEESLTVWGGVTSTMAAAQGIAGAVTEAELRALGAEIIK